MVGRGNQAGPSHVEHLESTALEELQMGFMEGPFFKEAEVTEHLGREDWCVVRRFVLVQGAEMKLRPIDGCLEAQLNQAFTVTSYLKLQDIDYIAGLTLRIAERLQSGHGGPAMEQWLGKCLDLRRPISRWLCTGTTDMWQSSSIMMGRGSQNTMWRTL